MAKGGVAEGNRFSEMEMGIVVGVGVVLNSTRRVLAEGVVLKEQAGEKLVWIRVVIGHAVVTCVEVEVRAIGRGHG